MRLFGRNPPRPTTETVVMLPSVDAEKDALVRTLHALLFLHFRAWPPRDDSPWFKNNVLPLMPLLEAYHESLHGPNAEMRQATAEDRRRWLAP